MKRTERQLRAMIQNALLEEYDKDAERFESSMDYLYSDSGLKKDAYKWITKKSGDKEKTKEFFDDVGREALQDIRQTAKAFNDLAQEELKDYGDASAQKLIDEVELEEVEEDVDEVLTGVAEFQGTIEKTVEKAYKAEDTEEYKEMTKLVTKLEKYGDFFEKLINMIIDYAKKKERQDVIELTQANLKIVQQWVVERMELLNAQMEEKFGGDITKVTEPTQKQMAVVNKFSADWVKDFGKIIMTLKKNPLKKLNKENLLESVRKERRNFLMERRLRRQIRNILGERR